MQRPDDRDYRDVVIAELADAEAGLREENAILIDILADVVLENCVLRSVARAEFVSRVHGDATVNRLHRCLRRRDPGMEPAA